MIKDNPDDTVREEQNGAETNASGTEDSLKMETEETAKAFKIGSKEGEVEVVIIIVRKALEK